MKKVWVIKNGQYRENGRLQEIGVADFDPDGFLDEEFKFKNGEYIFKTKRAFIAAMQNLVDGGFCV